MVKEILKRFEDILSDFKITKKILKWFPDIYLYYLKLRTYFYVHKGSYVVQAGVDLSTKGKYSNVFFLSQAVGKYGKVIAIEPDPKNIRALDEEIKNKGLTNILVVNKALWNKNEKKVFLLHESSWSNKLEEVPGNIKEFAGQISVEADRLDNILQDLLHQEMNKVSYICLTVNGAELEALEGMTNVLTNKDLTILIANQKNHRNKLTDNVYEENILNILKVNKFKFNAGKRWILAKKYVD